MKHALLASLALVCVVCLAGCGSSSGIGSNNGGTTFSAAALSGQYAFSMSGYDSTAGTLGMAGSIKADGAGHITGGEIDVNDNGAPTSISSVTGTYSFDAGGNGTLGTIVLTNTSGTPHPLAFGFALNSAGTFGTIMDLSANNFIVAGTMQQQTTSVFTLAAMAGSTPYIITINGRNGSAATSELGSLTLSSTGGAASGTSFDRSISNLGTTATPDTGNNAAVTFSTTAPDANGRGLFTLFLHDGLTTDSTQNFAYYAISANRFVAVETDSGGTMIADASRQSALTGTSVNTTGAVFGMAGLDTVTSAEIAAVGQLQITASNSATLGWDSNDLGTLVSIPSLTGQAVTFNAATGRGTITVASGAANGLANSLVFYLSAPGTGFIMDASTGTANRAMGGTLTAQTTISTVAAADFTNLAILRTKGVAVGDAQSLIGEFGATTTTGVYAILSDQRFPSSGSTIQTATDSGISPITVGTISAAGRGTLINGTEVLTFYVIGPNQFVMIDTTSGTSFSSSLFFATPD